MKSFTHPPIRVQQICHKVNIYSINSLNAHAFALNAKSINLFGKLHLDNYCIGKIAQSVQPATDTPHKPHFMAASAHSFLVRPLFWELLVSFDHILASQIALVVHVLTDKLLNLRCVSTFLSLNSHLCNFI